MKRTIISMFFSLALCVLPSLTHAEGIPPNQLPVWTGPTNATSTVGDLIEFTVTVEDPDNEPLVITTVLPDGASYDEPSGQFSWRPNTAGIHYARFNASDGRGSSLHKVTIEVTEHENHLPIFTGPESATTTVGALLEFTVTVSDPDGDLIDLSIMRPAGAIYATSTGLFSWTATATGTVDVIFEASDGRGTSTHSVAIEIQEAQGPAQNLPPQFINFSPGVVATSTEPYSYGAEAADPENDPIAFFLENSPEGMDIATSTGIISWTPSVAAASTTPYEVVVGVTDSFASTTAHYFITVVEGRVATNSPPIFTGPESATTTVGALLEFTVTVSDPDGDLIDLSIMRPAGAIYATSTGLFSWTATATGTSTVMFSASDKKATTTHTTLINILAAPTPPQPPPPPTGGGGGGGGGGVCCPGNGPPGLIGSPSQQINPPTGGSSGPIATSTSAINPVPLQPIPKLVLPPPARASAPPPAGVIKDVLPIPMVMATSASAEGRSVAAVLLAGLFNLFDWFRLHWCEVGWLLWLLTLLAFLLYVFLSMEKKEGTSAGDVPEGMLISERPPDTSISEYWETHPAVEPGSQEKEP